ncbi:MAG: hypothetical protein QOE90_3250 [Thermoplasmata archaeon]|jgi:hypothetical protein|nr:hypothetical protein [Thermoplasmata archaeon]
MQPFDRFAQRWDTWDAQVHDGEDVRTFLDAAKDEELLELLAAESPKKRKYERDIVMTELQNRMTGRNLEQPQGAADVLVAAELAYEAAANGQMAIHTAEAILKASGSTELGSSVSSAAYLSLDTSRVALDAARAHSAELQAALAQSRVAERLIEDAAEAARLVVERAAAGAKRIEELGHREEADAAREAAALIQTAVEVAAKKLRLSRGLETPTQNAESRRLDEAKAAAEATELIRGAADLALRKLDAGRRPQA